MSNSNYSQGAQDAQQGKGAANTHGMNHHAANAYNAGYAQNQNTGKK